VGLFHRSVLLAFLALSVGCSGGGSSSPPPAPIVGGDGSDTGDGSGSGDDGNACDAAAQIDFVEEVVDSWYLWYDEMADVNKSDYDSAQGYLDARLAPLIDERRDLFSRMTTITEDETSISSGAYIGFGFRSQTSATKLFIIDVFESGPAYAAGVRRGMEIIAVDTGSGFETLEELSARGASNEEIFGASEVGVSRIFRFLYQEEELEIEVVKEELSPPALAGEPLLIERAGLSPVGYLHFRQFIDAALDPADGYFSLSDASRLFNEENVTDLIVDLRYNGGGLLSVADTMMDLLRVAPRRAIRHIKCKSTISIPITTRTRVTGESSTDYQTPHLPFVLPSSPLVALHQPASWSLTDLLLTLKQCSLVLTPTVNR